MKFYISSSLDNAGQVRRAAGLLKESGWIHTCDWTEFSLSSGDSPEGLREIGEREYEGVREADVVIALAPRGRGTHVELGMALALGKKVYLHQEDGACFQCGGATCAFYWLPRVKRLTGELTAAVKEILRDNPGDRPAAME